MLTANHSLFVRLDHIFRYQKRDLTAKRLVTSGGVKREVLRAHQNV